MIRKIFFLVVFLLSFAPMAALANPLPAERGTVYLAIMPGAQFQRSWDLVPVKLWAGTVGELRGVGYPQSEDEARRLARAHGADYFVAFYGYEETPSGQGIGPAQIRLGGRVISLGGQEAGEAVKVHLLVQKVATDDVVLATFGPRRAVHLTTSRQGELGVDETFVNAYAWGASRSDAIEAAVGKLPVVALPAIRQEGQAAEAAIPELGDGPIPGTPLTLYRLSPWQVAFIGPKSMDMEDLYLGVEAGRYYRTTTVWRFAHWQSIKDGRGEYAQTSPRWLKPGDHLTVFVRWQGQRVGTVRFGPLPAGGK